LIVLNELLIFWIIVTVDLGEEGGYGLIKDFASTMIICRMDEMIFHSAGIHSLKERFDEIGRDDLDNSDNIMDHGFVVSKACNFRITVFIFHKLLFVAAIIITIIRDANGPQ